MTMNNIRKNIRERMESPDCPNCGRKYGSSSGCKVIDLTLDNNKYLTTIYCPKCLHIWKTYQTPLNDDTRMLSTPEGRMTEYHWVWKHFVGPIPKGAVIHHLNGIHTDNRVENLACILTNSEHACYIPKERNRDIIRLQQERIRQLEKELREVK